MGLRQCGANSFALDEDNDFVILPDCVIDFFSLLCADIGRKFKHHLERIENVVSECADERLDTVNPQLNCVGFSARSALVWGLLRRAAPFYYP